MHVPAPGSARFNRLRGPLRSGIASWGPPEAATAARIAADAPRGPTPWGLARVQGDPEAQEVEQRTAMAKVGRPLDGARRRGGSPPRCGASTSSGESAGRAPSASLRMRFEEPRQPMLRQLLPRERPWRHQLDRVGSRSLPSGGQSKRRRPGRAELRCRVLPVQGRQGQRRIGVGSCRWHPRPHRGGRARGSRDSAHRRLQ